MNSTTVEDYDRAIRAFVADMRASEDSVASILLYGSVARESVVPGESDLLDALVFLWDEVFQDRERFLDALRTMVESCQRLLRTGIPFHPFIYFSRAEAGCHPALYLSNWKSDETSRVLYGEDIRPQISSRELSQAVAANAFFEGRRVLAHPLAAYLTRKDWTPQDRGEIVHRLISLKKHMTIMACFALGISTEASQAAAELEKVFPDLDTGVLKRIDSLRDQTGPREELRDPQALLREMLIFVEDLHDRIIQIKFPRS